MNSLTRNMSRFLVGGLFLTTLLHPSLLRAEDKDLSLEDLAQTDAAKKFIAQQYDESLGEFQKLEKEYPRNTLIKRYIASLYDVLRRWDKAIAKLQEILDIKEDDFISRQMLGDIYIKQTELDKAEEQFQIIAERSPNTPSGVYAKQKLEEIQHLESAAKTEAGKRMAGQDFMKTAAAQHFSKGKYAEALEGFNQLLQEYPEDLLVRRFRAITIAKLGKMDEAISAFQEALRIAPDNVALHFYQAEAYLQKGQAEEARKEYQWVIAHDETSYRYRAQQALFQTLGRGPAPAQKPWSLSVIQTYDYDTNAAYASRDSLVRSPGDQNSSRFNTTFTGTYRLYQKAKWIFMADALYTQSLYTDFLKLQTYTPGLGLSAIYPFTMGSKPAFFSLREGITQTYLRNKFYVVTNSINASFVFNFHKRLKTTVSHRWSYSEYDNGGATPDTTSRNGFGNTTTLANTWYFNELKTRYGAVTYDYDHVDTLGVDYVKNAHGVKVDLHSPLVEKIEGEVSFRFRDSDYPKFSAGPPNRRDSLYSLTTTLNRPLRSFLVLSTSHTFERVSGENNSYEYWKNLFTVQVTLRY